MEQTTLQAQLVAIFQDAMKCSHSFHKKNYAVQMDTLLHQYAGVLGELLLAVEESEQMQHLQQVIPDYASSYLEEIASKRKRELLCFEYNMTMVSYVIPLFGERKEEKMQLFLSGLIEVWNQKMPGNPIGQSSREQIQNGFRSSLCYITTAVCESLQMPDDCYELTLLRNYRDTYLLASKQGEAIVKEYYDIAPTILKRIHREANANQIFHGIWETYLCPCVTMIEQGELESCKELYSKMVRELEQQYMVN
jgi:hypothetical protein